jgi:RHS repeat-associated protein
MTTAAICATREVSWSPSFYRGEQYDSDLGLYYLRARYYNPLTGRFMSRDPQEYTPLKWTGPLNSTGNPPLDPKKLHKYLYAGGDPVNMIDPLGKSDLEEESDVDSIITYQVRSTGPGYRISIQKTLDELDHVLDDITCLADCDGLE